MLAGASACTSFYEIPIETPIQPKMDVSMFQRVLIAGFIGGGTEDVDANLETVRLLRSQLRSKSSLRVIEAEVLQLADIAKEQAKGEASAPPSPGGAADGQQPPPQAEQDTSRNPQREGPRAVSEHLRRRRVLEEAGRGIPGPAHHHRHGPLLAARPRPDTCPIEREYFDQLGRRRVIQSRVYQERKGFTLQPKLIYIDGRTGATLYSETLREEILYNAQQNTPGAVVRTSSSWTSSSRASSTP